MSPPDDPHKQGSWLRVPGLMLRRGWSAWRLWRRGLMFKDTNQEISARAYAAMNSGEFAGINAFQAWADWRVLPRLVGLIPVDPPWHVIDLGCGQGVSTEVLAWCCPPGSRLLGIDLSEAALSAARQRCYRHSSGQSAAVQFRHQAIDQPWVDAQDRLVADNSITLVNASGIMGHHLDQTSVQRVVREIDRVLAPGGWAVLGFGPRRSARALEQTLREAGFIRAGQARSWWLDPCGQLAFQRQRPVSGEPERPLRKPRRGSRVQASSARRPQLSE